MRIGLAILGFISAFLLPWWITLIIMVALSVRYRAWEVLFMGLTMDFLWMQAGFSHLPIFLLASIVIVWILEPLRDQLLV